MLFYKYAFFLLLICLSFSCKSAKPKSTEKTFNAELLIKTYSSELSNYTKNNTFLLTMSVINSFFRTSQFKIIRLDEPTNVIYNQPVILYSNTGNNSYMYFTKYPASYKAVEALCFSLIKLRYNNKEYSIYLPNQIRERNNYPLMDFPDITLFDENHKDYVYVHEYFTVGKKIFRINTYYNTDAYLDVGMINILDVLRK